MRFYPNGRLDLIFNFGSRISRFDDRKEIRTEGSYVVGAQTRPVVIGAAGGSKFLSVSFKAGVAFPFLHLRFSEITNCALPLSCVWNQSRAEEWEDRLSELRDWPERIAWLNLHLIREFLPAAAVPNVSVSAVHLMEQQKGIVAIERICNELSITRQQLARKFDEQVGVSPKMLARIIRFRYVLDNCRLAHWGSLACDAGYYDQAHLIADFKEFTGLTPRQFVSNFPIQGMAISVNSAGGELK